ncbi:MAG TPA: alpha/beta hydrolase [Aggregatilineales bacterium]|nr:alpha/beta hydrolase [Aggregatilineales bacterium]
MNAPETHVMQSDITGKGEPLVLVPGGLTGWLSWQPHAARLAASYRVVRLQLLSVEYGLKGAPLPEDYSALTEKQALQNALDDAGIETAHFAAWSYGGAITLAFALAHPERVRSLTLIEPPAIWALRSRGPLSEPVQADWQAFRSFGPNDITEAQLVEFTRLAAMVPPATEPRELPQWPVWVEHRQSLRMGDAPFRLEGDIEAVRRFDRPVLLLKGRGSATYYHEIIDVLAEAFPDSRVETLPEGHAPHVVSMGPFMELFQAFLSA